MTESIGGGIICKQFCFTEGDGMSKNLKMSVLLDFYGDILTDNQREAMDMFYNGDYSLAEISDKSAHIYQNSP